ncbi:hypothetical protein ACVWZK_009422 [Bradyrhizobium sp. GM0.4]
MRAVLGDRQRLLVPVPVRRLMRPVSPNSIASITPLLPDPLGPEMENVF